MKLLAFTDSHGSDKALKSVKEKKVKEKPDYILCLGDFTIFGHNQKKILKKIDKLGKNIFLIHGNHEFEEEVIDDLKDLKNIKFIHGNIIRIGNYVIIAWGGGGFAIKDNEFYEFSKELKKVVKKNDKIILLTHGPPYGTKIDLIGDQHCGTKTYTSFIKKYKPILALAGHLHENNGLDDYIGKTKIVNPGPEGRIFLV